MNLKKYELSILIPARQEQFLARTIEDLLSNKNDFTEIIVVLDGAWADPPIESHQDLTIVYNHVSVGQRAATNQACKLSSAKYVAKTDAHCSFDKDFDKKLIDGFKEVGDNVVMVPIMRNLWAFDWKCTKCGKRWYQGPTPTECKEDNFNGTGKKCDSKKFTKKMIWKGKNNPQSTSFCFDSEPHFQYFNEWKDTEIYKEQKKTGYTESMSLQGSFFMCTREKYWELNICDENFGSWGSQGIEVSVKFWLSGGKVICNHHTWYAHLFRTQGGDFSFPYPQRQSKINEAKKKAKNMFFKDKWEGQKKSIVWLVEKFWPVRGWSENDLEKLKKGTL